MPNYRRYPDYQPTNIDWLGNIPQHWVVKRLKHVLSLPLTYGANEASDDDTLGNPRYVRITDITPDGNLRDDTFRSLPEKIAKSYLLDEGDILLARSGATVGKSFIYKESWGVCCFAGYLIRARINAELISPVFAYYCLQSSFYWYYIFSEQIQATIQNVSAERYGNLYISFPCIAVQNQIVAFLDRETAKIDQLIAKQQQLIELLKEKRQAVISHAVTKGLNPDVKMKASGVEWLGDVPEHWVVSGFKKYLESIVDYRGKTPTKVDDGIFLVTARNIKNGRIDYTCSQEYVLEDEYASIMSRGLPAIGDVLFTTEAPLGEVAQVDNTEIALAQRIIKFCGKKDALRNDYLSFYMSSLQFQAGLNIYATGSTALGIKADRLGYLKHLIPPLAEQSKIVSHIKDKNEKFDALIAKAEQQIGLLQERRAALISAAVTGKIDVREAA